MDKNTLSSFVFNAAEEAFSTMLGWQITLGEASVESLDKTAVSDRVVALIGLAGHYNGTGVINCSPELACKLSSQILMTEFRTVGSEVLDAMSEISNIIFGNVKTMLEERIGLLGLSVPTVIFGRNFRTGSVGEQWVAVPLKIKEYDFELRMCLSPSQGAAKQSATHQPAAVSA